MMIPGWPYSVIVALETGRSSWTAPLDAVRLAPGDDAATVTAAQVRGVVDRLIVAGHWQPGDPDILLVADAGYDGPRLSHVLADLPIVVLVRMRSDRVLRRPAPPHLPGTTGRPRRHGGEFAFGDPRTWGEPDVDTRTETRLYGPAHARAWDRLHPRLTHRIAWGHPRRESANPGRHRDPLAGRPAAIRGDPETGVVVAFPDRPRPGDGRSVVAGVPAPVRHRAHLPHAQTDTRLDHPETPVSRGRRPMDLAAAGRLHPTTPRSRPRSRSTTSVGETRCSTKTVPGPGPTRVSAPACAYRSSGRCPETFTAWSRPPCRSAQPPTRATP
jgi:DDE superfamily endonuclease